MTNTKRLLATCGLCVLIGSTPATAAQQIIGQGTGPNTGTGDQLYTAFGKINANFTDLYNTLANRYLALPALTGDVVSQAGSNAIQVLRVTGKTLAGVAFSGSAADLGGTLAAARMPALSGDCSTAQGATLVTCTGLAKVSVANTWTAQQTFAANIGITGTTQDFAIFSASGMGTDQKTWDLAQQGTSFSLLAANDSFTAQNAAWTCNRGSGYTVTNCSFATNLIAQNSLSVTGALTVTGGGLPQVSILTSGSAPFADLLFGYMAGATDNKYWDFVNTGTAFSLRYINDALVSAPTAFYCTRVGIASAACQFNVPLTAAGGVALAGTSLTGAAGGIGLGNVTSGVFSDGTNLGIRLPTAGGNIYFQSPSGSTGYGNVGPTSGPSSSPGATFNSLALSTTPLDVGQGGTGSRTGSGTALDNVSGASGTGIESRTGPGAYSFSTLSALIDGQLGSAQGDVLYRGASGWTVLTPGTAGYSLITGGSGAAPSWAPVVAATPLPNFRNRLINGDMRVDQRNAGAAQTITAGAALAYTVDRWYAYSTGANVTGQQVAGSGVAQNRYQFTGATGVTAIGIGQRIEANNAYDLNGTTASLAADLADSTLTTVTWTAYYPTTTANTFGTLASPTRTQIATGTFTVSGTVARYSTTIALPAGVTKGVEVVLSVAGQTSGTFTVGNVQLEGGGAPTTFEKLLDTVELSLCKKYFQWVPVNAYFNAYTGGIAMQTQVVFPVAMFATPTVGATVADPATSQNASNESANGLTAVTSTGALVQITAPSAGASYLLGYRSSAAAEL